MPGRSRKPDTLDRINRWMRGEVKVMDRRMPDGTIRRVTYTEYKRLIAAHHSKRD